MRLSKKNVSLLENVFNMVSLLTIHAINENNKTNSYTLDEIEEIQAASYFLLQQLEDQFGVSTELSTKKIKDINNIRKKTVRQKGYTDIY